MLVQHDTYTLCNLMASESCIVSVRNYQIVLQQGFVARRRGRIIPVLLSVLPQTTIVVTCRYVTGWHP
jgi:hypothetical protein